MRRCHVFDISDNNTDAFVAQFGAATLFNPDDPFVMVKGEYKYLLVLCTVVVPGNPRRDRRSSRGNCGSSRPSGSGSTAPSK